MYCVRACVCMCMCCGVWVKEISKLFLCMYMFVCFTGQG